MSTATRRGHGAPSLSGGADLDPEVRTCARRTRWSKDSPPPGPRSPARHQIGNQTFRGRKRLAPGREPLARVSTGVGGGGSVSSAAPPPTPSPAPGGHLPLDLGFLGPPRVRGASIARSPWGERESVQTVGARSLAASSEAIRGSERQA